MKTIDLVGFALGLTEAESDFIDRLHDSFSEIDLCDSDVRHRVREVIEEGVPHLQNALIGEFYSQLIEHYVLKGLEREKFSTDINSVCSSIRYDGVEIKSEDDLDKKIGLLFYETDPQYLEDQVDTAIDRAESNDFTRGITTPKQVEDNAYELLQFMPDVQPDELSGGAYKKAVEILTDRLCG